MSIRRPHHRIAARLIATALCLQIGLVHAELPDGGVIWLKSVVSGFVSTDNSSRDMNVLGNLAVGRHERFQVEQVSASPQIVRLKSLAYDAYVIKADGTTKIRPMGTDPNSNTAHFEVIPMPEVGQDVIRLKCRNNGSNVRYDGSAQILRANTSSTDSITQFRWGLVGHDRVRIADTLYSDFDVAVYHVDATEAPYHADKSGVEDATAAIQAALNSIHQPAESSGVVYLPPGQYRLTGPLTIPAHVTLRGDWKRPTDGDKQVAGTQLLVEHGAGLTGTDEAAIKINAFVCLRDLSIYYPGQDLAGGTVKTYPYAIDCVGAMVMVRNLTLVNPYEGIFAGEHLTGDRPSFVNIVSVYGTPLKTGVLTHVCYGSPRFQNLKFAPDYWAESGLGTVAEAAVRAAMRSRADLSDTASPIQAILSGKAALYEYFSDPATPSVAFRAGDADGGNSYMGLYFSGYDIAMQIFDVQTPRLLDFEFTECRIGLDMQKSKTQGWMISKGLIDAEEIAVKTHGEFNYVGFSNIRFRSDAALILHQSGTMALSGCTMESWGTGYAITAHAQANITGNHFLQPDKHVRLGVSRSVVYGNTPLDDLDVLEDPGVSATVDTHSYHSFARMDPMAETVEEMVDVHLQVPRPPAGDSHIFNVKDYGARGIAHVHDDPVLDDDTAAFQAALDAAGALADPTAGCIVYVPYGVYRIGGRLHVPSHVELRGTLNSFSDSAAGTILALFGGKNDADSGAIISLAEDSGVVGFGFYRPEQKWNLARETPKADALAYVASQLIEYPFAVEGSSRNWVYHCVFGNIYDGIDFSMGGGHRIEFVFGPTLNRLIRLAGGDGSDPNDLSAVYSLQVKTDPFGLMRQYGPGDWRIGNQLWNDSGFAEGFPTDVTQDGGLQYIGTSMVFEGNGHFRTLSHFNSKSDICYEINGSPTLNMYLGGAEGHGAGIVIHSNDGEDMDLEVVSNSYHAYDQPITISDTSAGDVFHIFNSKQYSDPWKNHILRGSGRLVLQGDYRIGDMAPYLEIHDQAKAVIEGCCINFRKFDVIHAYDASQVKLCGSMILPSDHYSWWIRGDHYRNIYVEANAPETFQDVTNNNDITDLINDPDRDEDGVGDVWEHAHFGDYQAIDGSQDSDGDGVLDFFECLYDSDPNAIEAHGFRVLPIRDGGEMHFEWVVANEFLLGRNYLVNVSSDLKSWDELPAADYRLETDSDARRTTIRLTPPRPKQSLHVHAAQRTLKAFSPFMVCRCLP